MAFESEKQAKEIASARTLRSKEKDSNFSGMSLEDLFGRIKDGQKEINVVLKADVNGTTHDAANLLGEAYKGLLQWQSPPGGFESELKNIDIIQKGTLKLKIGPHYCLTNLVCQEANFTFSKQMVKFPVNGENKLSPLFCDVSLTLRPATLYSDIMMKKFVSGKANYIDNNKWKTSWVTKDMTEEEKSKLPADTVNTFEKEPIEEEQRNTSTNAILNKSLQEKISDFSSTYRQYK